MCCHRRYVVFYNDRLILYADIAIAIIKFPMDGVSTLCCIAQRIRCGSFDLAFAIICCCWRLHGRIVATIAMVIIVVVTTMVLTIPIPIVIIVEQVIQVAKETMVVVIVAAAVAIIASAMTAITAASAIITTITQQYDTC